MGVGRRSNTVSAKQTYCGPAQFSAMIRMRDRDQLLSALTMVLAKQPCDPVFGDDGIREKTGNRHQRALLHLRHDPRYRAIYRGGRQQRDGAPTGTEECSKVCFWLTTGSVDHPCAQHRFCVNLAGEVDA